MAFDSGVGFAFTGRDVSLGKTAKGAASSIDLIGSAVDGVGAKLADNAQNVQAFLQEFSQKQLDRITSGLDAIAGSASINQTSLEGMAAAAAKTAKPIVASLGLTGEAARKAKSQIVGLSIGLNVGAEAVGNAVKAWQHYGKELKAVGIDSVKTATKFQEVSGVQIEKLGSQVAGLARSWDLTEEQLSDLVPWIFEAGKAFGFGAEAIQGMEQVTGALDQSLSKVLLKDGPAAIMKFTKGIYGLALVSSKTLGMDFPDALAKSTDLFNKLAGDVTAFQKQFTGLATEFGPLADQLGLALGDWHKSFELVQEDPAAFAQQIVELAKHLDPPELARLKLVLGENSEMLRFLIDNAEELDHNFADLAGVTAGADALKNFADAGHSTGRTMAEVLDMMRERSKLRFMAISKSMWKPYMKSLREGYSASVGWLKKLSSDTEPGGVGFLVNAAAMGMRFGLGGFIRGMFPPGEGDKAMGIIDALGDSLADMLPHLTALGALGFRPSMLAAPFQYALGPLKALAGPLAGFSGLLGGIPGMALKIFGPIGILTLAIGGFTLLTRKWKDKEESRINVFFKKELPIIFLRGLSYALTGKDLTKQARKDLAKTLGGKELWGMVAKQGVEMFGKGLEIAMEAFTVGTEVMGDIAGKLADGIASALEKTDWAKFGAALTQVAFHLSSAMGKIIATVPKILSGLVKGITTGLAKVDWGSAFKGLKEGLGKGSEEVGETVQAGFGLENILGAGFLVGVPLLLRKFKKIGKEGKGILGGLRKDAQKGVPPEMAGLPKCIPTCAGGAGMVTGGAPRGIPAPTMVQKGPMPPPLSAAAKGYPMGAVSGPGAVMQPIAKGPGKMVGLGGKVKALGGRAAGWKGAMGMGGMGGAMAAIPAAAMVLGGEELGGAGAAATYGGALAMGGLGGVGIAAGIVGAAGAVKEFQDTWSKAMTEIRQEGGDTADEIEATFGVAMASISEGVDDMTGGVTKKIRGAASEWLGINEVTGSQIGQVWKVVFEKVVTGVKQMGLFVWDSLKNLGSGVVEMGKGVVGMIKSFGSIAVEWTATKIEQFVEWGKLTVKKAQLFFKQVYYGIQDVIDETIISSLKMFQNLFDPLVSFFKDMNKTAKTLLSATIPGFKELEVLVTAFGETVVDKVGQKIEDQEKKRAFRAVELIGLQTQLTASEMKYQQTKLSGEKKVHDAIMDQGTAVENYWSQFKSGGLDALRGLGGAAAFVAFGATPIGMLASMLVPEKAKQKFYGAMGMESAMAESEKAMKKMDNQTAKLLEMQADQTKITGAMAEKMGDDAKKAAIGMLSSFEGAEKEFGISKKALRKMQEKAAVSLGEMSEAASPEAAAEILEKAVGKVKGKKKKEALAQMLSAAGMTMFATGPISEIVGKKRGAVSAAGMAFTEALAEAQVAAFTDVGKKSGKAYGKAKKLLGKVEEMRAATAVAPAAVAPAATVTMGGVQFTAPPPPGAASAAAAPAPAAQTITVKLSDKPVELIVKSPLGQTLGGGTAKVMGG